MDFHSPSYRWGDPCLPCLIEPSKINQIIFEECLCTCTNTSLSLFKNNDLRSDLKAAKSKQHHMSKMIRDAEEKLHATNVQKQSMEESLHRQCKC